VLRLVGVIYREEGISGFFRGIWIPLMSVSLIRATTFTIYDRTTEHFRRQDYLNRNSLVDAALTGGISGAMAGAVIAFGNAPFELVKIRRQLEYTIAASKGIHLSQPPGTLDSVREIVRTHGLIGLYIGFRPHFVGTALYFLKYDAMRHYLGRSRSGVQGPTPHWLPIHSSLIPFLCGSVAGVSSWGITYPLDVVKTKLQQRALANGTVPTVWETFHRIFRGPYPNAPQPTTAGIRRIYRGLGLSSIRSVINHGLLWTFYDIVANYIDRL